MKFEIKKRWSSEVQVTAEIECDESASYGVKLGLAIKWAIKQKLDLRDSDLSGSDLSGSNLRDSDLSGSDLRGSNLSGSDLRDSDLSGSDLSGSNLSDSDLSGSDLSGSNLRDSDLSGSDLSGSNLRDSDLSGSDLRGSNLSGSNLSGSDLTPIRDDFWAVLSAAPSEVMGLRKALVEGKINGSSYEGDCACLVGTMAKVKGCGYDKIPNLAPNGNRPAERFFLGIRTGDKPENNQASKLALAWLDTWVKGMKSVFGKVA